MDVRPALGVTHYLISHSYDWCVPSGGHAPKELRSVGNFPPLLLTYIHSVSNEEKFKNPQPTLRNFWKYFLNFRPTVVQVSVQIMGTTACKTYGVEFTPFCHLHYYLMVPLKGFKS